MPATYTFDVFSSLDGFGGVSEGSWGGYWGKQGPELLSHRLALYGEQQRMRSSRRVAVPLKDDPQSALLTSGADDLFVMLFVRRVRRRRRVWHRRRHSLA